MRREVFEIVQGMDLKDIETQLALQCAPLITGLKISNLLIIPNDNLVKAEAIIQDSGISSFVLLTTRDKTTILLYRKWELEAYLAKEEVKMLLQKMGYQGFSLSNVLLVFQTRYQKYMRDNIEFPHELGVLLGYPIEDIEGFIKHEGKNFLYNGYWKVYENLSAKMQLFYKFEMAKELLIQLVSNGVSMVTIIRNYNELRMAAV